jgi:hypothetical protein
MKLLETLHFSENNYQQTISRKYFSYTTLAKEIYRKRANETTAKTRLAMSIATVHLTGGLSFLSAAANCRNMSVEARKLKVLEVEWARRGQCRLPERSIRDQIILISIAIGTSAITIGIDIGLSGIAPVPDVFHHATPMFLNGHLVSEALCTHIALQQLEVQGVNEVLDEAVERVGEHLTSQVVSRDSASAQFQ